MLSDAIVLANPYRTYLNYAGYSKRHPSISRGDVRLNGNNVNDGLLSH